MVCKAAWFRRLTGDCTGIRESVDGGADGYESRGSEPRMLRVTVNFEVR